MSTADQERRDTAALFERYAAQLLDDICGQKRELDAYAQREIRDAVVMCSQHGVVLPQLLVELLIMAMPVTQHNPPVRSQKFRQAAHFCAFPPPGVKPTQTAIRDRFAGNSGRAKEWLAAADFQKLVELLKSAKASSD